ncbi:MAG: trigger factor [Bacillota bacterium]
MARKGWKKQCSRLYKKLVPKYNIPGFRKGKAPRFILERYIGSEVLYGEAADILLPSVYFDAVKETAIEPVDQPEVEIVQLEAGKPFVFKAQITVKPEVKLGEYKGFEVEKKILQTGERQVDEYLKKMQDRYARLVSLEEGEVEKDDIAVIDYEGRINGELFPGGSAQNYSLAVGANSFVPGFTEQLMGMKVGEQKEIKVTFPQDYHAEELAGKEAVFTVTVKELKRKELSPLDDEFAKDVSEFETLEELKADIRKRLAQAAEGMAERAVKEELIRKASENAEIEIPEVMIERRIDLMLEDFEGSLFASGLTLEQYLQAIGKAKEEFREEFREQAKEAVHAELTLEAIASAEKMEVTDEELKEEFKKIAEKCQRDVDSVEKALADGDRLEGLKHSILLDKVVDLLVQEAKITEKNGSVSRRHAGRGGDSRRFGQFGGGRAASKSRKCRGIIFLKRERG